jgi:hypothetical protein
MFFLFFVLVQYQVQCNVADSFFINSVKVVE